MRYAAEDRFLFTVATILGVSIDTAYRWRWMKLARRALAAL